MEILLDGESRGVFDIYDSTLSPRSFSFDNLDNTVHIIQVRTYQGRAIVDAFRTPGTPPFITSPNTNGVVRYEEYHASVLYDGQPFGTSATKWVSVANPNHLSFGYGVYTDSANSSISLDFAGPWLNIGFMGTTNGGVVEIFVDNVSLGTIDTYRRVTETGSATFTDLGSGSHSVTIKTISRPTGTLGGARFHFDYIDVWDGTPLPSATIDHTSSLIQRSRDWSLQTNTIAQNDSYLRDGQTIWGFFTGDSFTLNGIADTGGGVAEVFVDSNLLGTIDFYNPSTVSRAWSFDGFGTGAHVFQVRFYRGNARFDTITTPGSAPFVEWPNPTGVVRYEEDHTAYRYGNLPLNRASTVWATFTNDRLSGRNGVWTSNVGATIALTFTGTWVNIGFFGNPNSGTVTVSIDGVSQGTIDTYRTSDQAFNVLYSELSAGTHTITLSLLGTPSGRRMHLDYIDVWDGTTIPSGTFEHDHERVYRSGSWGYVAEPKASAGSYIRNGYSTWFHFTGDTVTYQSWMTGGTVDLVVDGIVAETISLQPTNAGLRAWTLTDLGTGPHVLEVRYVSGTPGFDHAAIPGRLAGAAPAHVWLATATDTSMTVAWDAALAESGIASYDVYVGDALAGTSTANSLVVSNLLPGTSYEVSVVARDTNNQTSDPSEPVVLSTTGTNPNITLVASLSPSSATTDEKVISLVVEARDQNNNLFQVIVVQSS